jgi:hypothetical protein
LLIHQVRSLIEAVEIVVVGVVDAVDLVLSYATQGFQPDSSDACFFDRTSFASF